MKKKTFRAVAWLLTAAMGILFAAGSTAQSISAEAASSATIQSVKSISEIFGDGLKVTNVVVEYDKAIDPSSLSTATYEVEGRTVIAVHTNSEVAKTDVDVEGNYVVIELEVQSAILQDSDASDGRAQNDTFDDGASVVQKKNVKALDGTVYKASSETFTTGSASGIMGNDNTIHLIMDDFEDNHFYTDPEWKLVLHYNLYTPEGYETAEGETYPLVLFIPDAGAVSSDWETVLQQGKGGTVWASEEWQAENPCFVVTMIYDDKIINDYWEYYENYIQSTINLIYALAEEYPVDTNRIYTTGQSMGAMASFIMMELDPDLFAAAYCIAGQWDCNELVSIKDQNILMLASEDDDAIDNINNIAVAWEASGKDVATAYIGVSDSDEVLTATMNELLTQDTNLFYCKIRSGDGSLDIDGNSLKGSHRMTWRLGYDLPGVKEWLFAQSK